MVMFKKIIIHQYIYEDRMTAYGKKEIKGTMLLTLLTLSDAVNGSVSWENKEKQVSNRCCHDMGQC